MQVWNLLHSDRWNTGRKKVAKNRHLGTIAQLCRAISSQLRHVSTIGKKLVKQQYVLHMSPQYGEIGLLAAKIGWPVCGTPANFNWFRVLALGSVTARHLVVGVSQTLRCWTEGATYVGQGDHLTFLLLCNTDASDVCAIKITYLLITLGIGPHSSFILFFIKE